MKRLVPLWQLVERYGNETEGWHLVLRRGDAIIDLEVTGDQWRAFDSTDAGRVEL